MATRAGVLKIARFNWPWYALAGAATAAGLVVISMAGTASRWAAPAATALVVGDVWLVLSLAVSHYVYDRSPVARGGWLAGIDPAGVKRIAIFHAGQDEATATVVRRFPAATLRTFDFYDGATNGTPSLERARALAIRRDEPMAPNRIPLPDASLDLCVVAFAAHEIRRTDARTVFFRELARVITPAGRVLVVEHLRDAWNFAAYGPGAFHFLARATWLRSFAAGGLQVVREAACTPFVRVFELRLAPAGVP